MTKSWMKILNAGGPDWRHYQDLKSFPLIDALSLDALSLDALSFMSTPLLFRHFSTGLQLYGAVSYLRLVNSGGDIHCSFVMGKSRLALLKPVTIPRMELSAAVLSARLDRMIQEDIEFAIDQSLFWTDSTCVLCYVENEDKRYQTFVAN